MCLDESDAPAHHMGMTTTLKLTHVAIYDPDQLVIWGYGETHDAALADARQEFLDSGYEGDPEDECKSVSCSEALAKSKRGGEFDFVIVPIGGDMRVIAAVTPDEAERFERFEAP